MNLADTIVIGFGRNDRETGQLIVTVENPFLDKHIVDQPEVFTAGTPTDVGIWLEKHGYQWIVGSAGLWSRNLTGTRRAVVVNARHSS